MYPVSFGGVATELLAQLPIYTIKADILLTRSWKH